MPASGGPARSAASATASSDSGQAHTAQVAPDRGQPAELLGHAAASPRSGPPQVTSYPAPRNSATRTAEDSQRLTAAPTSMARAVVEGRPPPTQTGMPAGVHRSGHRGHAAPPLLSGIEGDAVGIVLLAAEAVARADAGDQPTARDLLQAGEGVNQHRVGDQADPGHQGADVHGGRRGRHRAEQWWHGDGRALPSADGPQMIEAEQAVQTELLGPDGRGQRGGRVVDELGKGDADPQLVDSTRARRSRNAIDMIRLWARILMKPGSGTFISTSRW